MPDKTSEWSIVVPVSASVAFARPDDAGVCSRKRPPPPSAENDMSLREFLPLRQIRAVENAVATSVCIERYSEACYLSEGMYANGTEDPSSYTQHIVWRRQGQCWRAHGSEGIHVVRPSQNPEAPWEYLDPWKDRVDYWSDIPWSPGGLYGSALAAMLAYPSSPHVAGWDLDGGPFDRTTVTVHIPRRMRAR